MPLRKYIFSLYAILMFPLLISVTAIAQDSITVNDINHAEKLVDLQFTVAEKDSMRGGLEDARHSYDIIHRQQLANSTPLPLWFDPLLATCQPDKNQQPIHWQIPEDVKLPEDRNELAYYSILQLASLIKHKKISSVALTKFFLSRLKKYGDTLKCVISLTPNIALKEARQADEDLARGIYRGPLQGIPYGVKDLFAVKGTKTTWGTTPYKNQEIDQTAYVVKRLQQAGAVLIAKLSLGELAMDDVWFGGQTKNPWDLKEGSSGSSAGPASATVAGLVPFSIGTETWGSIVSPSTVCGATGLRPTFGSISRSGAMTLAWSSDKIGPICRSAEDDAIVFSAIHGTDGKDGAARNVAFNYSGKVNWQTLKIAYAKNYIDTLSDSSTEKRVLATLKNLGAKLIPMTFPDTLHPNDLLGTIVAAESAAAFDELTRSNRDDLMAQQRKYSWPNQFRTARFIPAVEYINANRERYQLMQIIDSIIDQYDVIIAPTFAGQQLATTNLTGHPVVCLPDGFDKKGHPQSITFIGKLYDEATILAVAKAYQDATDYNKKHPPLFR